MKKLTKAQQALLNRLEAGENIYKGWMQTSFRGADGKHVSNATVSNLIRMGKLAITRKDRWETLVVGGSLT